MSKNKHMLSNHIIEVGAERRTAGPVSLAQGVYGTRGNLELIACDAEDGLWVFWFNADDPDEPTTSPDVPPGSWSGGLAFAQGHRYVDAQIVQSTLGPDHLEVLALTSDGVLQSWFWSPGPGFRRRDADAADHVTAFTLTHDDGTLHARITDAGGTERMLESAPEGYPERSWRGIRSSAAQPPSAAAQLSALGIDDVVPDTARVALSTRDGGTTELTWRDAGGRIRHLGVR